MKKLFVLVFSCLFAMACENKKGLLPEPAPAPTPSAYDSIKYSTDIQPILTNYCTFCHSSAPVDFTNYAGAKLKVDDGTFKNRVLIAKDMPQIGGPISQADLDKLQCWLDKGAPNN